MLRSTQARGSSSCVNARADTWNLAVALISARDASRETALRTPRDLSWQCNGLHDAMLARLTAVSCVSEVETPASRLHVHRALNVCIGVGTIFACQPRQGRQTWTTHSSSQRSKRLVRSLIKPSLTTTSAYEPSCRRASAGFPSDCHGTHIYALVCRARRVDGQVVSRLRRIGLDLERFDVNDIGGCA